ncbi:DUF2267 domain-containing protein [Actinoplanes sp. NPDC020271]|uniref:DUF2267 domain-containing protein n=1 Tax=Actinoplanes sp. NPDC020271 TaxID=3363896 RepID=UPI0037906C8F
MSSTAADVFDHALHTAHSWLADVTHQLGTDDRYAAHRALRAWLHTLRDRLPAAAATDFAAQLPELFRGEFYDGWQPGRAAHRHGPEEYRERFALEAQIPRERVDAVAAAVTAALRARMSPGQVDGALELVAEPVRRILRGPADVPSVTHPEPPVTAGRTVPGRDRLSDAVRHNTEALVAESLANEW